MSFIVLNLVVLVKYCGCITQQNDRFIKVSLAEFILGLVIDINLPILIYLNLPIYQFTLIYQFNLP